MKATNALTIRFSRFTLTLLLGAVVLGSAAWHAGATAARQRPPATPTAIAVVNLPEILKNLAERTVRQTQLDESAAVRQAQLDDLRVQIEALQADLDTNNGGTLRPGTPEYRDAMIKLRELQVTIEARYKLLNQVLSFERGAVLRDLYTKIEGAVGQIADRDGWDLVLLDDTDFSIPEEAGQDDMNRAILSRGMLYAHSGTDISAEVIRLLNNNFQAGTTP